MTDLALPWRPEFLAAQLIRHPDLIRGPLSVRSPSTATRVHCDGRTYRTTALTAGLRRRAAPPIAAKPAIRSAQLDGSGTAVNLAQTTQA